jgi:peptide/nickel transport system substrate-binding protein
MRGALLSWRLPEGCTWAKLQQPLVWNGEKHMAFKKLLAAAVCALALTAGTADAKTFRYAFQGDLKSLDPYTLNETFTLGALGNVFEGLIRRGKNLEIIPGLAERWETPEPTRWRFHLRKGVTFHNGEPFTADDVLFSADRVRANGSNLLTRIPKDAKFVKVDDHTVDVVLSSPNPILHYEWDTWYIMSKAWSEKNNSVSPTPASATTPSFSALNANGTGAFRIESHQAGVRTVFKPNPKWWDKPEHNLTEVIFSTVASDPTRVAALLSGEVDWIEPVPPQDMERINANPATQVLTGPELRTIFLGFDQTRDELRSSNVKGKNPFKDARVRQAFYQAIDIETIKSRVMRNLATPTAIMISPLLAKSAADIKRFPYDVEASKKLLAEAGYPNGFEVMMDCPNDRYVNDEAICQATVGMLARAGIKVQLNAQPKAKYFAKVLKPGGYDTAFYLLGWTPGSFDSWNVLFNLYGCRNDEKSNRGESNLGGYCNPKVEALTDRILVENDTAKRDAMIREAYEIAQAEAAYIPLHQQALAWGVSRKVKVALRADNQFLFYWTTKE